MNSVCNHPRSEPSTQLSFVLNNTPGEASATKSVLLLEREKEEKEEKERTRTRQDAETFSSAKRSNSHPGGLYAGNKQEILERFVHAT